ncbi:MAG: hypothetical protein AAGI07_14790, partial [Bacteroidota bacterium]
SVEYVRNKMNPIIANTPAFIDQVDGSLYSMKSLGNFKTFDQKLENYRKQKGYPHVIKFPPKGNLNSMTNIEKVMALIKTGEFVQIEEAIKIIKQKELFDLNNFIEIINGNSLKMLESNTLLENIANGIAGTKNEFLLHESRLKKIHEEIKLFASEIERIYVYNSKLEEISDEIFNLPKLKKIHIELTPLKTIPFKLERLKKLESIKLYYTNIPPSDSVKFVLPKNCKIEIEGDFNYIAKELNNYFT